jgi:pimeloyl-ACP methyl ester carboxylesterase
MPVARTNGVELFYESFGDPSAPPLLLIMGLGAQLLGWDEGLCRQLVARGYHVIRFDNRDVGLSSRCVGRSPYTLDDMADDVAGLLDALALPSAHIAGCSMGGMIAQLLAIRHPTRVRSLASIMSTTGAPGVGWPRTDALWVLMTPSPTARAAFIEHMLGVMRFIGSPAHPVDEVAARERIAKGFDRGHDPAGVARQARAVLAQRDRTEALATITVPTVVIHGEADLLVQHDGGVATARAIPGARFVSVPGMGHDLPAPLWPLLVDAIDDNARRA